MMESFMLTAFFKHRISMRKDLCSTALKEGNASTAYQVIMAVWVNATD